MTMNVRFCLSHDF